MDFRRRPSAPRWFATVEGSMDYTKICPELRWQVSSQRPLRLSVGNLCANFRKFMPSSVLSTKVGHNRTTIVTPESWQSGLQCDARVVQVPLNLTQGECLSLARCAWDFTDTARPRSLGQGQRSPAYGTERL